MKHTIVATMLDEPGVLNRVVSLFRRRGFNIDSLTVGPSEQAGISRMTVVVDGDDEIVEQVGKQLYKLIEVLKVSDLTHDQAVARDLMLLKVSAKPGNRGEIAQVCDIFDGKIVDVAPDAMMLEITGPPAKLESALQLLRPYGLKEMVRTGAVAMVRGSQTSSANAPGAAAAD